MTPRFACPFGARAFTRARPESVAWRLIAAASLCAVAGCGMISLGVSNSADACATSSKSVQCR